MADGSFYGSISTGKEAKYLRKDTFADVLKESGRSGKPVFIDCYTG